MAEPRSKESIQERISFWGYKVSNVTFFSESDVRTGDIVMMSDNFKVCRMPFNTSLQDQFIGICKISDQSLDDTTHKYRAVIQTSGYIECQCDGKIPLGYQPIKIDGRNVARFDESSYRRFLVVYQVGNIVGFIL